MPMYNLIKCNSNYSKTTESLWFYSNDEANDFNNNMLTLMILNLSIARLNY